MKICIGQDVEGNSIYKDVVGDVPPEGMAERRYMISRKSDEELLKLCGKFEEVLDEIYRETRRRAIQEEGEQE